MICSYAGSSAVTSHSSMSTRSSRLAEPRLQRRRSVEGMRGSELRPHVARRRTVVTASSSGEVSSKPRGWLAQRAYDLANEVGALKVLYTNVTARVSEHSTPPRAGELFTRPEESIDLREDLNFTKRVQRLTARTPASAAGAGGGPTQQGADGVEQRGGVGGGVVDESRRYSAAERGVRHLPHRQSRQGNRFVQLHRHLRRRGGCVAPHPFVRVCSVAHASALSAIGTRGDAASVCTTTRSLHSYNGLVSDLPPETPGVTIRFAIAVYVALTVSTEVGPQGPWLRC